MGISPPPGYLCRPYFKVTARSNHGNHAVPVRRSERPRGRGAKNQVFLHYAPPPHTTTKPGRGWLRIVVRKLRFLVLFELDRTGNNVTAKPPCDWRPPGGWIAPLPPGPPGSRGVFVGQSHRGARPRSSIRESAVVIAPRSCEHSNRRYVHVHIHTPASRTLVSP